jgi:hypothetical protein
MSRSSVALEGERRNMSTVELADQGFGLLTELDLSNAEEEARS